MMTFIHLQLWIAVAVFKFILPVMFYLVLPFSFILQYNREI